VVNPVVDALGLVNEVGPCVVAEHEGHPLGVPAVDVAGEGVVAVATPEHLG